MQTLADLRDTLPQTGYVALPRAVSHTQVKLWRQLDAGLLENALAWTREAGGRLGRVMAGRGS